MGDVCAFRRFIREAAPDMVLLGPGSVGEGGTSPISLGGGMLRSEDLLAATGPAVDVFSYHLYAAVSKRCARLGPATQTTADDALSEEWFSRADGITAFYAGLRDRFEPGKPLWITETADAACGGNPWAATFLETFRYLDWHGRLARRGVKVIAHNTLASSDYGLLAPDGFAPRPSYWAALLWARLMGQSVLDPGPSPDASVHLYAHCFRGRRAALRSSRSTSTVAPPARSRFRRRLRHTLTAERLLDRAVRLNGRELRLGRDAPSPGPTASRSPPVASGPASITFLAVPDAGNAACN